MRRLALLVLIAVMVSVILGCGSNGSSTPAPTLTTTPLPDVTVTPTPTLEETVTPVVTSTPTPAMTLTPTPVSTSTPTPTVVTTTVPIKPAILEGMDFQAIDNRALNAPESVTGSVSSLASYLTQTAGNNDIEKARAIYTWIANNISYDVQSYLSKNYTNTSASDVLRRRTTICEGYANLFKALSGASDLEASFIGGWLKGLGYDVGQPLAAQADHAWNAVKIDGKWYLIDSTLASGYVNDSMQFVKKFTAFYFCTLPEQFIYDHFPEEQKWQLLDAPVSKAVFENMPDVTRTFFDNGLQLISHKQCIINTGGNLSVTIGTPSDVILSATLSSGENKLADSLIFAQRGEDNNYRIDVVFPAAGSYMLEIFAKNKADSGNILNLAVKYKVVTTAGKSGSLGFPEILAAFLEHDTYLMSPMNGHLTYGEAYDFKIKVPEATDVVIIAGGQWHHFTSQEQVFEYSYTVDVRGELQVYASFPDTGLLYKGLLTYICE